MEIKAINAYRTGEGQKNGAKCSGVTVHSVNGIKLKFTKTVKVKFNLEIRATKK